MGRTLVRLMRSLVSRIATTFLLIQARVLDWILLRKDRRYLWIRPFYYLLVISKVLMLLKLKSQKTSKEEVLRVLDSISQEVRDLTATEEDSEIEGISTTEAIRESEITPEEDFKTDLISTSKINKPFKLNLWWRFWS
jgi:hypothetical protein